MGKARVPVDMDERLKEAFVHRLGQLSERYTISEVVRTMMYNIMGLDNESLESLIQQGHDKEGIYSLLFDAYPQYKKHGLLPADYAPGNSDDVRQFIYARAQYEELRHKQAQEHLEKVMFDVKKNKQE